MADVSTRRKVIVFLSTRGAAVPESAAGDAQPTGEGQETPGVVDAPVLMPGLMADSLGEFGQFVRAAQRMTSPTALIPAACVRLNAVSGVRNRGGASSVTSITGTFSRRVARHCQ
jgi:hypothetical protein